MHKNKTVLQQLAQIKRGYADLPWYKRAWFFIWSFRLWYALFSIEPTNPTQKQVSRLLSVHESVWFFKSIFGILDTKATEAIKVKPFPKLANALLPEVGKWLTVKDLSSLTQVSRVRPFQPLLNVHLFLKHVTHGNYDKVEAMIRKDLTLLTSTGNITDCSWRSFFGISGFQYALWALDKHMWTRMLACIPKNNQRKQIKAQLLLQYQGIIKSGITYTLNGTKRTEPHFDFENTIIKELKAQVDSANGQNPNWDAIDNQWRVGVGGAQRLLPMHVVYEYCSDEPFYNIPSFKTQPAQNTRIYSEITGRWENWFHSDSKLGVDFAIFGRGAYAFVPAQTYGLRGNHVQPSLVVAPIVALYEVRKADFNELETELRYHSDETTTCCSTVINWLLCRHSSPVAQADTSFIPTCIQKP